MGGPLLYQQDLDRFCAAIEPAGIVVDVMPGQGPYTRSFLSQGFRVYALGLAADAMPDVAVPSEEQQTWWLKRLSADLDAALIPHRTCAGIWAAESLQGLDPRTLRERLSLFADWLLPQGLASFIVQEGEGVKRVAWHGQGMRSERSIYSYQPTEVEDIVLAAGLRTKEAWRHGNAENATLHILAQRP